MKKVLASTLIALLLIGSLSVAAFAESPNQEVPAVIYDTEIVLNCRDVGGYTTKDGNKMKTGVFLRSGEPGRADSLDVAHLEMLGIDCIVDLRNEKEANKLPDPKLNKADYYHCTISGDPLATLQESYISNLENGKDEFKAIFDVLSSEYETTLIHCAAGKDRTGLVSMLLQDLAGVDAETIVADYHYSETLLKDYNQNIQALVPELDPYWLGTPAEAMEKVLEHLYSTYGGAEQYLYHIGLNRFQVQFLKEKMIEK